MLEFFDMETLSSAVSAVCSLHLKHCCRRKFWRKVSAQFVVDMIERRYAQAPNGIYSKNAKMFQYFNTKTVFSVRNGELHNWLQI